MLCFKSELQLSQDGVVTGPGTATLPLKDLLHQLLDEVRPRQVLSLGTGGAVASDQELGDVMITRAATFRCGAEFEAEAWSGATFHSEWELPSERLAEAEALMSRHATELIEPAFGPPTKRFLPETPLCMSDAANRPRIQLDGRDMPALRPVLTADFFEFGTSADELHREGCAVELGDAVLGLACSEREPPPRWACVRSISHPQINADLQCDPPRLDMQTHWTVWYEEAFGYRASVTAAWRPGRSSPASTTGAELHPEDGRRALAQRRVRAGAERQTDDAARVERIDHAVVPEAGSGVIGMPLTLVLVTQLLTKALGLSAGHSRPDARA